MNSVGIIGLGRFGKVLASILQKGYQISGYDIEEISPLPGIEFHNLENVLEEDVIFIAVPIRHFKSLIVDIAPRLNKGTTIIDVCSVNDLSVLNLAPGGSLIRLTIFSKNALITVNY